jgi:hypothetical protein
LLLVSNPGDGVSEVVSSLSHQRGKKTTPKKKKAPQSVPSSNAIVSVSFSACRCGLVVVSSKEERKKKESGDSSVNGYLWLWLACPLLSACCCWRPYLCRYLG